MSDSRILEEISKFNELLNDFLSSVLTSVPDPLDKEGKNPENLDVTEELFIPIAKELREAEKNLDTFGRWIRTRRHTYCLVSAFLSALQKATEEKGNLALRIKLFVLPLLRETLKAADADTKLCSKLVDVLPKIEKIARGSSAMLLRAEVFFEIIGFDSRKPTSDIEAFFEALIDGRFDEAKNILEKGRARYEELKRSLEESPGEYESLDIQGMLSD